MAFVVGTTIALLFLHGVLKIAVIGAVALVEVLELSVWLRWRKVRATTGPEGMIGADGIALTDCDPEGRVKVKGQSWKALSEPHVRAGDAVRVVSLEGLRVEVTPR